MGKGIKCFISFLFSVICFLVLYFRYFDKNNCSYTASPSPPPSPSPTPSPSPSPTPCSLWYDNLGGCIKGDKIDSCSKQNYSAPGALIFGALFFFILIFYIAIFDNAE